MRQALTVAVVAGVLAISSPAAAFTLGHVFVANRGANNVLELDASLKLIRTWFDAEGLASPNGMAFDPAGNLYVADTNNNRVVEFDKDGVRVRTWSTATDMGSFVESIIFSTSGRLFASGNPGVGRVVSYAADGTDVKFLVNDPSFVALSNVNFTKSGNVLISDFSGSRPLRELDPTTGAVVKEFGAGYARHEDVIVDGDDNVFVSAYDRGSILKFDAMRNLVDEYKPEGLTNPTGIVLTPDCRLLVSSFGTSQLYELTFAGTLIKAHTITGLSAPESISLSGVTLAGSIGLVVATPRCGPKPDAGADAEADATSPDADVLDTAVVDAASDTKDASDTADAGKPVAPVADESGCGCTMVGAPTNGASEIAALLASFVALCRTRRRR